MKTIFILAASLWMSSAAFAQSDANNTTTPSATGLSLPADETIASHANAVLQDVRPPEDPPLAMGGPTEERTGYPPCKPGPGDDNCIQLYEKGVSGERS